MVSDTVCFLGDGVLGDGCGSVYFQPLLGDENRPSDSYFFKWVEQNQPVLVFGSFV